MSSDAAFTDQVRLDERVRRRIVVNFSIDRSNKIQYIVRFIMLYYKILRVDQLVIFGICPAPGLTIIIIFLRRFATFDVTWNKNCWFCITIRHRQCFFFSSSRGYCCLELSRYYITLYYYMSFKRAPRNTAE